VRVDWQLALGDHDVAPVSPILSREADPDAEAVEVEPEDEDPLLKTGHMLDVLVRNATNGLSMDQAAADDALECEEIEALEQGLPGSTSAAASSAVPSGQLTEELWASLEGELDVSIFLFVTTNPTL
jgi:hypothetical protein